MTPPSLPGPCLCRAADGLGYWPGVKALLGALARDAAEGGGEVGIGLFFPRARRAALRGEHGSRALLLQQWLGPPPELRGDGRDGRAVLGELDRGLWWKKKGKKKSLITDAASKKNEKEKRESGVLL